MFGNATLDIPASGYIGPLTTRGLSDEMAMIIGRTAAMTLSEPDSFITVTLESGEVKVIGYCTLTGALTIRRLEG